MQNKAHLNIEILKDDNELDFPSDLKSCYNAQGLYNSMQFVLRLRPDLHALLDKVETGIHSSSAHDFETVQAFSTYLHETIHWWQHVGSISGLILSFTYPSQSHVNSSLLKNLLELSGKYKPIREYNEKNAVNYIPSDEEFKTINQILNNFHDIEFFRIFTINPKSSNAVINHRLFESRGHSFHIAYSSFINLISSTFDRDLKFLPKATNWSAGFSDLTERKIEGHYYGSITTVPPIGVHDLFEGQARFIQIQYLYFGSGKNFDWEDFDNLGMLSGIYYTAFDAFLTITGTKIPKSIDDPMIALFLLVIDLSINPSIGFPFEIEDYESFVDLVDPGIRFIKICQAIKEKHPELKYFIKNYTSSEYFTAASALSAAIGCNDPIKIATKISEWAEKEEAIRELMEEERDFKFKEENQPVRVLFSRFIRFQKDKILHPEFFCWPGFYSAGKGVSEETLALFKEHQALFSDKADGDIYPRTFQDKDNDDVQKTFDLFYTWVSVYDLTRQWIVDDGEFKYNFIWLSSKHPMEKLSSWARNNFRLVFGVDPEDFKIISNS